MEQGIPVEGGVFYPSHLAKGLVASVIALGASGVAMVFWGVAFKEFSRIGTERYPEVVESLQSLPRA